MHDYVLLTCTHQRLQPSSCDVIQVLSSSAFWTFERYEFSSARTESINAGDCELISTECFETRVNMSC